MRIFAISAPESFSAEDAATIAYVDGQTSLLVPQTRTLTAGFGLTGGGSLAADRTLAVDTTVIGTKSYIDTADALLAPKSRSLTAGAGLTGGGDLSANRTFAVGAGAGITVNADDVAIDYTQAPTWSGIHTFSHDTAPIKLSGATPVIAATGTNAGLTIKGNLAAGDSGTDITFASTADRTAGFLMKLVNGTLGTLLSISRSGAFTLSQLTTWGATLLTLTGAANSTALAANTEKSDVSVNLARTVTFSTGTVQNQRAVYIQAPVYAGFGGVANFTNAATVAISGPPTTDGTITNPWTLLLESGNFGLGNGVVNATLTDGFPSSTSDLVTLVHRSSGGAGGSGIGVGLLFRADNAANNVVDCARINGVLTTTTAGSEAGILDFYTRSAGGALSAKWRVTGTGSLTALTDNTYDIGASSSTQRPRDMFIGRNATIGGTLAVTGAVTLSAGLNHQGSSLGFFNGGTTTKQTVLGTTFTNNITSGGTNNQADNWTDLTTYSNAAAAIRNATYQNSRAIAAIIAALRAYSFVS